jgi:hypothetical protein
MKPGTRKHVWALVLDTYRDVVPAKAGTHNHKRLLPRDGYPIET